MRDAVSRFVLHVGGQIIQRQHRCRHLRKLMFHGEQLVAVAQRALGEQSQLGEAVQDNA
jgi:hypothetical protein